MAQLLITEDDKISEKKSEIPFWELLERLKLPALPGTVEDKIEISVEQDNEFAEKDVEFVDDTKEFVEPPPPNKQNLAFQSEIFQRLVREAKRIGKLIEEFKDPTVYDSRRVDRPKEYTDEKFEKLAIFNAKGLMDLMDLLIEEYDIPDDYFGKRYLALKEIDTKNMDFNSEECKKLRIESNVDFLVKIHNCASLALAKEVTYEQVVEIEPDIAPSQLDEHGDSGSEIPEYESTGSDSS